MKATVRKWGNRAAMRIPTSVMRAARLELDLISGAMASVPLADQAKNLDWRVREAQRKNRVTADELTDVRAKLIALVG